MRSFVPLFTFHHYHTTQIDEYLLGWNSIMNLDSGLNDGVDLVLVEAPHVGVLLGEAGDHGDLVQAHQARTQHRLHVTWCQRNYPE